MRPICFVMLPQGNIAAPAGPSIDFDAIFERLVAPAVAAVGAALVRAVTPAAGTVLSPRLLEQLVLSDMAVVDLAGADPSGFHAIGLREGIRPVGAVLMQAGHAQPLQPPRLATLSYRTDPDGQPSDPALACRRLSELLADARARRSGAARPDWPASRLVANSCPPQIARLATDVFRDRTQYSAVARDALAAARREGPGALHRVAHTLGAVEMLDAGVAIDLLLSYRTVGEWRAMVDLIDRMPAPLARAAVVREQAALALNRLGRSIEAEQRLRELLDERGPSSETNGLLGRIFKDRWQQALGAGDAGQAARWLAHAIDAYLEGFQADWRDAYPGINAATLMEVQSPPDVRRLELLPVVAYAARRRVASDESDYWDHATLIELAVLQRDEAAAECAAANALAAARESWEPEATARNLALIRTARATRGEGMNWSLRIEHMLNGRAATLAASARGPHAD